MPRPAARDNWRRRIAAVERQRAVDRLKEQGLPGWITDQEMLRNRNQQGYGVEGLGLGPPHLMIPTTFRRDARLDSSRVLDLRGGVTPAKPPGWLWQRADNMRRNVLSFFEPTKPSPEERRALGLEELRRMGQRARLQQTARNKPGR